MRRITPVFIVMLSAAGCGKQDTPVIPTPPDWTVTARAIGTTSFGQAPAEFARGQSTTIDEAVGHNGCEYWTPAGAPVGFKLMIDSGRVVRVDADSSGAVTARSVGVGSTISEVEAAYGPGLQSEPHKYNYDQGWRRLIAWEPDSSAAIVFEVDSNVVRRFYAGLAPQVLWVESCS